MKCFASWAMGSEGFDSVDHEYFIEGTKSGDSDSPHVRRVGVNVGAAVLDHVIAEREIIRQIEERLLQAALTASEIDGFRLGLYLDEGIRPWTVRHRLLMPLFPSTL